MDVQTGLVCVALFIISGAVLLFISMFGMREKTYEEAIAEQRKMPNDALLLGRPNKDKNKEKKQKRQGKKVKEKLSTNRPAEAVKNQSSTETDSESTHKDNEHSHVNFHNPEAEVINKVNPPHTEDKKKKKKEKIKPILVNKEEQVIIKDKPSVKDVTVNHFTEIIPKDDLQLKLATNKSNSNLNNLQTVHTNSNENFSEKDKHKSKSQKAVPKENKADHEKTVKNEVKVHNHVSKTKKKESEQIQQSNTQPVHQGKAEVIENASNLPVEQSTVQQQKVSNHHLSEKEPKSKKQKKNELTSLQQMSDKDGVNIQLLVPLIRKAELSRTEVQILTDILLTKHFDEVSDHFEWIEGRQDPTVKLKKQLAEKEKALAEEQEASQAFQNKLKELRSEYNAERARLTQACRQYDETVLAKQQEIQNLHATNRHLLDSHVAEKQALTQKIQQLQAQVNDENMVIRKLQEDHNQTQNALQQELVNQRQQMEMHIGRLSEQLQETQKNVEAQIHAKIQEAEQIRASFNAELQKNRRYEEELRELREQHCQNQSKIKSLESKASQLKESSNHTQELARQIEELQRSNIELEKRLGSSLQLEEELKFEKNKLQNEIHGLTINISELQKECQKLTEEKNNLSSQMTSKARVSDLTREILKIREENQCLISQVSSFTQLEREAQQLREENENLAAQVTAFTERPAADGRENGDSPYSEEKKTIHDEFIRHETESNQDDIMIQKLTEDLNQKEGLLEKLNSELNGCQLETSRLSSELANHKTEVSKLKEELEEQRNKNNDLRQKNWKAMEALSAAEKSLENKIKETEKLTQDRLREEQQMMKTVLERIFPNIKIENKVYGDWLFEFENNAKNHLKEVSSASSTSNQYDSSYTEELEAKNNQLQGLLLHYKTIIEDTEGMLNKLQSHVEQEEIRWRQKFDILEPQIRTLKENKVLVENLNAELKLKVRDLEEKLAEKTALNADSVRQENELKDLSEKASEKCKILLEENEALNLKLIAEQEKNSELNKELVNIKSSLKIDQNASVEGNHKLELGEELNLLNSKANIKDTSINNSADLLVSEGGGYDRE